MSILGPRQEIMRYPIISLCALLFAPLCGASSYLCTFDYYIDLTQKQTSAMHFAVFSDEECSAMSKCASVYDAGDFRAKIVFDGNLIVTVNTEKSSLLNEAIEPRNLINPWIKKVVSKKAGLKIECVQRMPAEISVETL